MSERWAQVERLYHAVLEREPSARAVFLDEACAGDDELRREVASLLAYDGEPASFIETPILEVAARELTGESLSAAPTMAPANAPAPSQIGAYQVLSMLGRGGMGEVWLAHDPRLNRKVAIKVLPAEFTADAERMRRFEQEARAASALNHPNIMTVYEIGEFENQRYIVTEYIEGETLRQRMARAPEERIRLSEVLETTAQVAGALQAAHEAGITHRDIKPENVMLRPDGYVKVLDFGVAKLTESPAAAPSPAPSSTPSPVIDTEAPTAARVGTEAGVVIGTVRYMSPEQARGLKVEARSDIFSLGVVLFEMVSGHKPFEGSTAGEVIAAILDREPPPLQRYAPEAPAELQRIVSKALAKERNERYQTIKDLQNDLRNLKQELEFTAKQGRSPQPEPRSSAATSSAEYLLGQIKRHKRGALLALAVPLMVAAAVVYFAWGGKPIDSVAVLPLVNASADPNMEYLSDGITESLINSLSQLPNLKVMSRNSVFRFKGRENDAQEVGQKLGVQAVFTGRVTHRGDGLAISIELVNARDNSQIWGQQYICQLADVFAVQEEIANEISEKLRLKLTGAERQQLAKRPTENLKAFQYYMQGREYAHRRTREDLLTAIRYCEKATEEDRNYALAYAGLADAYTNLGSRGYIAPSEGKRKAEEAARKALALDENLAEAHATLGSIYTLFAPPNFSQADRALRRAIELSPNLALAHQHLGTSLVQQGRLDEALQELLKARELDPLSPIIARAAASPYYFKRDYPRALELLRQANELGPAFSTTWEIGVYVQNRSFDEALAELEKAKQERKSDPMLIYSTGMVYAAQRKRAEGLRIIKELEEMSGASLSHAQWIAKIYAALNDKELSLTWLERGLAAGAISLFFKDEPVWDTIRSDPRFADLLRRMGITP